MQQTKTGRSPAILLAAAVLVAAVAGTAIAGPDATTSVSKKQTKKISKKEAKKYFNNNIGDASVASAATATSADTATSATTAGSANPIAFARVNAGGGVQESRSKGISDGNVIQPGDTLGAYCFGGLGFAFKGATTTIDYQFAPEGGDEEGSNFAPGDPFGDCPASHKQAIANTWDGVGFANSGFYIVFFN